MNMNFEPMLAEPGTLALSLVALVFLFAVVVVAGLVATVYFIANRGKSKPVPAPTLPVPPSAAAAVAPKPAPLSPLPVTDKTKIMPRQCPQCGAELKPDAPEGLCPACLLQHGIATEAGGGGAAATSFVPPSFSELAQLFPQLEILDMLGRGGMGAVYKARQPRLDRLVALKILAPEKQSDPQFAERFEREARALARLNHPNIVTVYDFGEVQGRFYLLMEYVDGLTLRQLLQHGKLVPDEALHLVPKICEALQFAHEHGIIHRDIKPENILLDKQGRVKIADFGIAKITGLESKDFSLTGAKDVMGTPHYMAPEQVEHPQAVDHRADIYSLGVVFYEMLTGELPLGKFAPPSQKVSVDVRLDEVVLHALEKEPARRYQQANQVKTDVENVAGSPTAAPALPDASATNASEKAILPAFLLALFFGVFGAHRFYVGKFVTACAQLLLLGSCILWIVLCAAGAPQPLFGLVLAGSIVGCLTWATIDWLLLACKAFHDGKGRRITNWTHADGNAAVKSAGGQMAGGTAIAPLAPARTASPDLLVTAPAVALMIAGALNIVTSPVKALFLLSSVVGWAHLPVGILAGLLMLIGGYQMLKRRGYAWAVTAGIAGLFACSLVSLPIGIWALIVLARDDVKAAFGVATSIAPTAGQPDRFWRRFAVVIACIVFIPLFIAVLGMLAAIAIPNFVKGRARAQELSTQQLQQAGIVQRSGGFWKNSTQTFPLDANGRFSIDNVNGKIEIHGWSSNLVTLTSAIHGRSGDAVAAVKINVDSAPGHAAVHTDLGDHLDDGWNWLWLMGRDKATVDYTVQVPQQARLSEVSSVNGHIKIEGVAGDIQASTVNGETEIENAAHNLSLSTVNGTITANLEKLGGGQTVKLHAVNGEIALGVPENADANFSVTTINGDISSEFPSLQAKKEFPVGNNLKGTLGHGGGSVKVDTVNGTVKFLKRQAPEPRAAVAEFVKTNALATAIVATATNLQNATAAMAAAEKWLALMDAGDFSDSWRQASDLFRNGGVESAWKEAMNTDRKPLGRLVSRQLISSQPMTQLPGAPDGQYVVMLFQTSFAEKKSAVETVTFDLEKDGQWKSCGYFIK